MTTDVERLVRRYQPFSATAPKDFRQRMISFWMENERYADEAEALSVYGGAQFDALCKSVIGVEREYAPDLGYSDKAQDGKYCFMVDDNNFVIPVAILYA